MNSSAKGKTFVKFDVRCEVERARTQWLVEEDEECVRDRICSSKLIPVLGIRKPCALHE
jgi:hypothetical protein